MAIIRERLPDKSELTDIQDPDLIHVVDVSDETSHPDGTSKKSTWEFLKGAIKSFLDPFYTTSSTGTRIISGGMVWVSGLTYESVDLVYEINGVTFNITDGTQVTLNAAPTTPTFERFDVIYGDDTGSILIEEGIESATPVIPALETSFQLELTVALLLTNATEPDGVEEILVYQEDLGQPTEYDLTENTGGVRIDVSDTSTPITGTASIKCIANLNTGDTFNAIHSNAVQVDEFTYLRLSIKSLRDWGNDFIQVRLRTGSTIVARFKINKRIIDVTNFSTPQTLTIFKSNFGSYNGTEFDNIDFYNRSTNRILYVIDDIFIQTGVANNPPVLGNDEKVKVSSNDTTPGFLNGKLVAGTNITLVEGNDGGDETLTISSSGGGSSAPILYNVKDSGALGDGIDLTDGAITATDATFTSASNPFVSGDVGKVISIEGAGTAGAYHVTTIASFTGAGEVELTDAGVTTVSGAAVWFFGTDDTTAIQDTETAAFNAGGGVVYFPIGIYIIDGALQNNVGVDNVNYNSQIWIHEQNFTDLDRRAIEFRGEVSPNLVQVVGIGVVISPNSCVVLRSTIQGSGTRPSVICNRGASTNFEDDSYTSVVFKNLSIQLTPDANSKLTMGGINCSDSVNAQVKDVTIFPYNLDFLDSGEPDVIDIVGISMPKINCNETNTVMNCSLGGFTHGYTPGDHTVFFNAVAISCVNGFTQDANHEVATYVKIEALWCKNGFNVTGESTFNVLSFQIEWASQGKWYDNVTTIKDTSNLGKGTINWNIVEHNIGYNPDRFVKVGGNKIITRPFAVVDLTNTQSGTTYTPTILDAYRSTKLTNAAPILLTTPPFTDLNYDINSIIDIEQGGDGQVQVQGGSGVTVNTSKSLFLRKKYSSGRLRKVADNIWTLSGDLETAPILLTATVETADPTDVVMVFNEIVTGTNLGFTIGGTTSTTFSSISGSGTNTITGVLAVAVSNGETVTLSYDKDTGDMVNDDLIKLKDISSLAVVNNVGSAYLLDTYTSASSYGFQKVKATNVNSFKIRRSSDGALTDVLLETAGSITLSSTVSAGGTLGTWLSTDDGFVHTFYDLSGNSNHMVQATNGDQAKVASAGVLELKNGNVCATFTSDFYIASALTCLEGGNDASIFSFASVATGSTLSVLLSTHTSTGNGAYNHWVDSSGNKLHTTYQNTPGTSFLASLLARQNNTNQRYNTSIKTATDIISYYNGTIQETTAYSGVHPNFGLRIGGQTSANSNFFTGTLQELHVMPADQTSNRVAIEADITGRY